MKKPNQKGKRKNADSQIDMSHTIEGPFLEKADLCEPILRSLPDWFDIEEAIVHYVEEIDRLPTWLAVDETQVLGFVSVKQHYQYAAEIYVMGIRTEAHRRGIGRGLIAQAEAWCQMRGIQYLQVKTLGPSHSDTYFARTRSFYEAMGFIPLEEIKEIWDEDNPCLIMIKKI